jgi:hypothetical protein
MTIYRMDGPVAAELEDGHALRKEIRSFLGVQPSSPSPEVRTLASWQDDGYVRHLVHLVTYGGNTTLFLTAVDEWIRFGCASGALASYRRKMADGTGIEMAEVITHLQVEGGHALDRERFEPIVDWVVEVAAASKRPQRRRPRV